MGAGVPHRIGRHVHPHAAADQPPPPAPATGINYLDELVEAAHTADLARRIDYAEGPAPPGELPAPPGDLPAPPGDLPGQLDRTELTNRDDRQAAS